MNGKARHMTSNSLGRGGSCIAVALVLAAALMSGGDVMQLNAQGVPSRIAFTSNRDGNFEIYAMNADGSGLTRMTNHLGWDDDPAWSPDGSRIAFRSNRDGNWEIYVMNADGSAVTRLTNNAAFDAEPEWSPDGTQIAFSSDRYVTNWGVRVWGIYIMKPDGSAVRAPTPPAGYSYPDWSPDGQKITFHSQRDGAAVYPTDDIWVVNVDGSALTRLTNRDGFDGYAAWSPDGSQIAFNSGFQIYVVNADGSAPRQIGVGAKPAWSPDGLQIAFEDTRDGGPCCSTGYNVELYVVNADGSSPRRLTNHPAYDQQPAWSR
jgi:Tol biopolymer transport system component